jgi:uncharacterized membrane protein
MATPDPTACSDARAAQQEAPRPTRQAACTAEQPPGFSDDGHTPQPKSRPHHPVVSAEQAQRAADLQLRIADRITAFAGSMQFVYIHVALFAIWMLFIESRPWPRLTLIVSLEAIFLSTFVMISQNRQADFQQAKADHDFTEQELELKTSTQLTARSIHSPLSCTTGC